MWGSGVRWLRGCLRRIACLVVFVVAEGAILYPYFCGIVYALYCFTLTLFN